MLQNIVLNQNYKIVSNFSGSLVLGSELLTMRFPTGPSTTRVYILVLENNKHRNEVDERKITVMVNYHC